MKRMACVILLMSFACNDSAKDKEIAELKARLAASSNPKPSMSAVDKQAAPALVPGSTQETTEEPSLNHAKSFSLDVKGQLDRIDYEEHQKYASYTSEHPREEAPTQNRDDKILGIETELLRQQPRPEDILDFAAQADAAKRPTYALLQKNADAYAGTPYKCGARILEIEETKNPPIMAARVTLDYFGHQVFYVFGRFNTDFVRGNTVDIIGYLAGNYSYQTQAGWNMTIPAIAVYAMVKYNSIQKVKAIHAKDQTTEKKKNTQAEL